MVTVAHPEVRWLGNKDIFLGNRQLEELAALMARGETGIAEYTLDRVEKRLAYAPVPLTGWSVAMTADTADVLAPAYRMRNISILVSVIVPLRWL